MPFIHGFGQRRDVDPFTFHVKFRQWYGSRIGTHRAGDDSERKARAKRNAWDLIFPIFETKNFLANCPWRAHRFARQKRHTNRNIRFSRIYHGFASIFFCISCVPLLAQPCNNENPSQTYHIVYVRIGRHDYDWLRLLQRYSWHDWWWAKHETRCFCPFFRALFMCFC